MNRIIFLAYSAEIRLVTPLWRTNNNKFTFNEGCRNTGFMQLRRFMRHRKKYSEFTFHPSCPQYLMMKSDEKYSPFYWNNEQTWLSDFYRPASPLEKMVGMFVVNKEKGSRDATHSHRNACRKV
ncbi:hypothetical protein [Kosakonia oryziphila]|uniref:hypothetical protein n=1 Tax=Kosakonia oryziphila TaxID=1005667 RepID=UPI001111FE49|nr:hypothetical protein [Kosakonia oryziphila]